MVEEALPIVIHVQPLHKDVTVTKETNIYK